MDPRETLRLADQAISDCDAESVREHLDNYRQWRERGGFEPLNPAGSSMHGDAFAKECERRLESLLAQTAAQMTGPGRNWCVCYTFTRYPYSPLSTHAVLAVPSGHLAEESVRRMLRDSGVDSFDITSVYPVEG